MVKQKPNRSGHLLLKLSCSALSSCFALLAAAQTAGNTGSRTDTSTFILDQYKARIGGTSLLFNGSEYTAAYSETIGTPFYGNGSFINGSVSYGGIVYRNTLLAFDLVSGELITKSFQGLNMKFLSEKVDSFVLDQHVFVHMNADENFAGGFYERVYEHTITVLVKRSKLSVRSLHVEEGNRFVAFDSYYLKMGNHFYKLSNKKSVFSLFHPQAKELRRFWKTEKIDFKKDTERAILRSVWFCEGQKNGK